MDENKVIAAILTVAYNASFAPDSTNHSMVLDTYETFLEKLNNKKGVPVALKPLLDQAQKTAPRKRA